MNKTQLAELCAELVEKGIRKKMARCVRAESTDDRAIALGALRMVHDVCAIGCEKAANGFLESYDYSIDGFSESLREPTVSGAIDTCLQEIAEENSELLQYIESPYTRLMIAWGGAMAFSCKKIKTKPHNAPHMERSAPRGAHSIRGRGRGRAAHGQVHARHPSPGDNVKTV